MKVSDERADEIRTNLLGLLKGQGKWCLEDHNVYRATVDISKTIQAFLADREEWKALVVELYDMIQQFDDCECDNCGNWCNKDGLCEVILKARYVLKGGE